jgi:hypothetical protein
MPSCYRRYLAYRNAKQWLFSGRARAFSSEVKRARAELRALARGPGGRRFDGFGFPLFVLVLLSGNSGVVFESIAATSNCNGFFMVDSQASLAGALRDYYRRFSGLGVGIAFDAIWWAEPRIYYLLLWKD